METAQPSVLSPLIFVGFLFVLMYFMIIRPQNKRNKEIADMVSQVEKGTEIIGAGGILGKVIEVKDLYVSIEISSVCVCVCVYKRERERNREREKESLESHKR